MNLTPAQRERVRLKYQGRCAYCGTPLTQKWHADHLVAVQREYVYRRHIGYQATGKLGRPEHDQLDNMMPACIPCNINKSDLPLERWRKILEGASATLLRNYATFKHAVRFGLVTINAPKVVFYFEQLQQSSEPSNSGTTTRRRRINP